MAVVGEAEGYCLKWHRCLCLVLTDRLTASFLSFPFLFFFFFLSFEGSIDDLFEVWSRATLPI